MGSIAPSGVHLSHCSVMLLGKQWVGDLCRELQVPGQPCRPGVQSPSKATRLRGQGFTIRNTPDPYWVLCLPSGQSPSVSEPEDAEVSQCNLPAWAVAFLLITPSHHPLPSCFHAHICDEQPTLTLLEPHYMLRGQSQVPHSSSTVCDFKSTGTSVKMFTRFSLSG